MYNKFEINLIKKYKIIAKNTEINKKTGKETTYYIVKKKSNDTLMKELLEIKPFDTFNITSFY